MKMKKHRHPVRGDSANRPFCNLALLLRQARVEVKPEAPKRQDAVPASQPGPPESVRLETDAEVFERAMEGIARIRWRRDRTQGLASPAPLPSHSEIEDMRLLQEAVDGPSDPPMPDLPEYIEGWVGVAGRRFLPKLRNGIYSIQGQIDLHGLGRIEARAAVEDFIIQMARGGCCCVKIVHGRGINSPDDTAVLKESLQGWLKTRRMSRYVVAYASAPRQDGGVGAVYVLLRPRLHGEVAEKKRPGTK
jgi:DNA-nicking Smr family endonuclease